jgi:hypothetical protein
MKFTMEDAVDVIAGIIRVQLSHLIPFAYDVHVDRPSSVVTCIKREKSKSVICAFVYTDDTEFADRLVSKMQALLHRELDIRYPELLKETIERNIDIQ